MTDRVSKPMADSAKNRAILIIYINIILYATCYQLQRPLEPFLVSKLYSNDGQDSSNEYAKLQSFFSIIQTVGSFISGILLDKFGTKGESSGLNKLFSAFHSFCFVHRWFHCIVSRFCIKLCIVIAINHLGNIICIKNSNGRTMWISLCASWSNTMDFKFK